MAAAPAGPEAGAEAEVAMFDEQAASTRPQSVVSADLARKSSLSSTSSPHQAQAHTIAAHSFGVHPQHQQQSIPQQYSGEPNFTGRMRPLSAVGGGGATPAGGNGPAPFAQYMQPGGPEPGYGSQQQPREDGGLM